MEAIDSAIMDPIENAMDSLGLMQGDAAPLKRAAFGAALGAAVVYLIKPNFVYSKDGKYKPFKGTADAGDDATWFPYWAVIGLPAVVFSTLI